MILTCTWICLGVRLELGLVYWTLTWTNGYTCFNLLSCQRLLGYKYVGENVSRRLEMVGKRWFMVLISWALNKQTNINNTYKEIMNIQVNVFIHSFSEKCLNIFSLEVEHLDYNDTHQDQFSYKQTKALLLRIYPCRDYVYACSIKLSL